MKVLKKGTGQKGWAKEFVCTGSGNGNGGCGAKLLVEIADIFKTESHARDETTIYLTFKCPECGTLTDIPTGQWPSDTYKIPSQRAWEAKQAFTVEAADSGPK